MIQFPSAWRMPCLVLGCVLLAACTGDQTPDPAVPAAPPAIPSPAVTQQVPASRDASHPRLQLTTLSGEPYSLAAQRGQWVVVNYWATWCSPCLKEMPELSALHAMREHIAVVGLAYEDIAADALRAFLARHPVAYPIAIVDVNAPPADFAAPVGLPVTYLIDPQGAMVERFVGPVTAVQLEQAIARHGGPPLPEADASEASS